MPVTTRGQRWGVRNRIFYPLGCNTFIGVTGYFRYDSTTDTIEIYVEIDYFDGEHNIVSLSYTTTTEWDFRDTHTRTVYQYVLDNYRLQDTLAIYNIFKI